MYSAQKKEPYGGWRNSDLIFASLASGAIWGLVAALIGKRLGEVVLGGVIVSPLIGLAIGIASTSSYRRRFWFLFPWSVLTLYIAVIVFGVAMGTWDVVARIVAGRSPATFVEATAHVIQPATGAVWVVTLLYLPYLWPLAWINHVLLRVLYRAQNRR
jgi:hypothetical protein